MFRLRSFAVANALMLMLGLSLFASTVLLPQYLQILMGYTAQQAGMVLSPGGVLIILMLPFVGRMVSRVDTRWMVAFGFSMLSISMFTMAFTINTQMDFRTAVELRAMQSVGMAFLFVPIQTIAYSGVPVQKNNQVSGIMNLSRNLGGDIGIAFVTSLIARRSQTHQARLSMHTTPYDGAYRAKLHAIGAAMEHAGSSSADAARQATGAMYRQLVQQATQLAYLDALFVLGVGAAIMVPILALTKRPGPMGAPAGH